MEKFAIAIAFACTLLAISQALFVAREFGETCQNNRDCNESQELRCQNGTCLCRSEFYRTDFSSGNERFSCVRQGEYGGECEMTSQCSSNHALECLNGTCGCNPAHAKPELFMIDGSDNCVGRIGHACLGVGNSNCESGAYCNETTRICECVLSWNTYRDENRRCQLKKEYGQTCGGSEECAWETRRLTCVNGTCGCLATEYPEKASILPWQLEDNSVDGAQVQLRCAVKANESCVESSNCVAGAKCFFGNSGRCQCDAGLLPSSTGFCGLGYGRTCPSEGDELDCSDSFSCRQGNCECPHASHQFYNETISQCTGLVSGPCSSHSDCTLNAECTQIRGNRITNATNGFCKCRDGWVENKDGKCDIEHEKPCEYFIYGNINNNDRPKCDQAAGLECRDKICKCPDDSQAFNFKLRKCVGLVGARCDVSKPKSLACVQDAACLTTTDNTEIAGSCQCDEGFEEWGGRRCFQKRKPEMVKPPTVPRYGG